MTVISALKMRRQLLDLKDEFYKSKISFDKAMRELDNLIKKVHKFIEEVEE